MQSLVEKLSIEGKSLKNKLTIISALMFIFPFLVFTYILYEEDVFLSFEYPYTIMFILTFVLALAGLVILRKIFDGFLTVAAMMKKAETGDRFMMDAQRHTSELAEIAVSFNSLMEKLENATKCLQEQAAELKQEMTLRREAEAADKAKSDFLSNMSHELRTPLNSIIGFSEVLREGIAGPLTEKQMDFLKDILGSGRHLLRLINDILDLSKVEAGRTELEPGEFCLKELLEGSLVMFREKAIKHRIRLKGDIPGDIGNITADEMKIKQVLYNLISNAMKVTPDGGSVHLTARRVGGGLVPALSNTGQPQGAPLQDFVEVSVEDTGLGIAKEDMDRLFKPFQRLETTATKRCEGTGLGLHLSKKFIELHGGVMWVLSEPGKGSKFSFAIPVRQPMTDG